jgi:hypothetical protein
MSNSKRPEYTVVLPNDTFLGKKYIEWIQDWSNWFYQANLDRNNDGDVVFLRSMPVGDGRYPNEPIVMVGDESLEITEDQRIFVPVITATFIANEGESPEWMYGTARSNISAGDDPPATIQLRINGAPIKIEIEATPQTHFGAFEFETPIYTLHIPDSSAGPSLKDQVEMRLDTPGYFPAVSRGYFVMLKLEKNNDYYIDCRATGAKTPYGPYHVSLFYHIIVKEARIKKGNTLPPDRLKKFIANKVIDKYKKGHLTDKEFYQIMNHLELKGQTIIDLGREIDDLKKMIRAHNRSSEPKQEGSKS